jgi:hypothetical protein
MKFILLIAICSNIQQACLPDMKVDEFDNLYDCAVAGYEHSHKIIKDIDRTLFNEEQLVLNFRCEKVRYDNI